MIKLNSNHFSNTIHQSGKITRYKFVFGPFLFHKQIPIFPLFHETYNKLQVKFNIVISKNPNFQFSQTINSTNLHNWMNHDMFNSFRF